MLELRWLCPGLARGLALGGSFGSSHLLLGSQLQGLLLKLHSLRSHILGDSMVGGALQQVQQALLQERGGGNKAHNII